MTAVGGLNGAARSVVKPLFDLLGRVSVAHTERVPTSGAVIVAANHLSFFDTPLLMLMLPRPVVFLGKAEYLDDWKTRRLFPALGMVPIQRSVGRAAIAALETAAGLLADGAAVGIYPEGTRSRDGLLHRGHTGVAHLALRTGAPILPIGLAGTEHVQPVGARLPRLRRPVTMSIGHPIDPDEYRSGGRRTRRQHLTGDVMAAIAALASQEVSPDFSPGEPPLVRAGSEAVYQVLRVGGFDRSGWAPAADRVVAGTSLGHDDARVGRVARLRCEIDDDGELHFGTELAVSVRVRPDQPLRT